MDSSAAEAALPFDLNADFFFKPGVSQKKGVLNLSPVCNQLQCDINSLICSSLKNKRNASVSPEHISGCSQIWQAEHRAPRHPGTAMAESEDDMKMRNKMQQHIFPYHASSEGI